MSTQFQLLRRLKVGVMVAIAGITNIISLMSVILAPLTAHAAGPALTYHGRLLNSDGTPVTATVQFKMQIRSPGSEDCVLYEETQSQNLSSSNGVFVLGLNDGNGTRTDGGSATFSDIMSNRVQITPPAGKCSSGTTYTPNAVDGRVLKVFFNDGSFQGWEEAQSQAINYAPKAIDSLSVGGYPAASLLRVADSNGSLVGTSPLSNAQYTELVALIGGTSGQYVKASGTSGAVIPNISGSPSSLNKGAIWYNTTDDQVYFYNGTSSQALSTGGGGGTSSTTAVTLNSNSDGSGNDGGFDFKANGVSLLAISNSGGLTQTYTGTTTSAQALTANSVTTAPVASITADGLTTGSVLSLSSASTATTASSATKGLNIAVSGANTNASATRYGQYVDVSATGATSTNVAAYLSATGATNNYGLIVGNGNVGIGTSSPGAKLDVKGNFAISGATSGAVKFAVPAAAGSATYTWPAAAPGSNMLLQSDNTGALSWVAAGGTGDFKADGSVAMTGALVHTAGTVGAPSMTFTGDTATGLYDVSAGTLGVASGGTQSMTLSSTAVTVPLTTASVGSASGALVVTGGLGVGGAVYTASSVNAGSSVTAIGNITASGSAARTLGMTRNATAATAGQGLTVDAGGAIAGTADLNGGDLTLKSGIATGTGSSNIYFQTATAGASAVTDRAPSTKMTILGSGNVGIGTSSPGATLDVKGNFAISGATSGAVKFAVPAAAGSATYTWPAAAPASNMLLQSDNTGALSWVAAGGVGDFKADGSVAMTGALQAAVGTAALPGYTFSGDTNTGISAYTADQLSFSTAGSERVTIDSSGRVGIGVSAPTLNLGLNGTSAQTFGMEANAAGAVGNQFTVKAGGSGAGTDLAGGDLYLASGGSTGNGGSNIYLQATNNGGGSGVSARTPSTRMVIMGAGQVSLGSSPAISHASNLTVVGKQGSVPYQQALMLYRETNTAGDNQNFIFGFKNSGGTGPFNYAQIQSGITSNTAGSHTGYLSFSTANSGSLTEAARILSSGYVGIGTSVPTAMLHVAGPMRLTASALPGSPNTGDIAIDSGASNTLKYYNGSGWVSAGSGSLTGVSSISNSSGNITMSPAATTGNVYIDSGAASTSTGTGALLVSGGFGLTGDIYAGASINAASTMYAATSMRSPQMYGSTSASGVLLIDGTSNATKGVVALANAGGAVGIGTSVPRTATGLEVSGPISGKASTSVTLPGNVDFANGNILHTPSNCQSGINLYSMKDGSTYTFVVKGTTSGTCAFTAYPGTPSSPGSAMTVHLPPGHGATTGTKHTLYSFLVAGTDVYVAWIPNL